MAISFGRSVLSGWEGHIMEQHLRPNSVRHPLHVTKLPKPLASHLTNYRKHFTLHQGVKICHVASQRDAANLAYLDVCLHHQCEQKGVLENLIIE